MDDLFMTALKKKRRLNTNHDHGLWIQLPEDVIFYDILSRLPVKSLLRFQCVSKRWCCLLTGNNHSFIDLHLYRSQSRLTGTTTNLLMSVYNKKLKRQCLVLACPEGGRWSNIQLLSLQTVKYERFYLSQNINGLVCWLKNSFDDNNNCAYICNPSTCELTKLPTIHRTKRSSGKSYASYHFGFDPSSKAFKVLNIRISRIVGRPSCVACHIYTLGGNSWRRIHSALPFVCSDDLPWGLSSLTNCVCLNGALHWIHLVMTIIVVFDLKDEKFRIIPLPKRVVFPSTSRILLLQVDGNLVIACIPEDLNNYGSMKMELWTLEDYQKEVWIKEDIIMPFRCDLDDCDVYAIPTLGKIRLKPLTFNNGLSGEVYLAEIFYDVKNKSFSSIRIPDLSEGFLPHVQNITNYTESIFSLSAQQTKALSRSGKENIYSERDHIEDTKYSIPEPN